MDDSQRKELYTALLRGVANECQDRLCAADEQHAWGQWTRYQLRPDAPFGGVRGPNEPILNHKVTIRAERQCLNCGKEQHA